MKLALVCRSLPCHRQGGLEWHAWDAARGLARRGHNVRLVTSRADPRDTEEFLAKHGIDGVSIHGRGAARGGLYSTSFMREAAATCVEWARRGEIDIIHSQGYGAMLLGKRRLANAPLVVTIHGTWWSETWLDRRTRRFLATSEWPGAIWRYKHRFLMWPMYAMMLRRADAIVVDSVFTRNELARARPRLLDKITVVPLGVDLARYAGPSEVEEKNLGRDAQAAENLGQDVQATGKSATRSARLLALGRIEKSKGFDVALRALVGCENRAWTLTIAGDGPDRARLEDLAKRLGIVERVRFVGRVPDAELGRAFADADLFLHPDLTQPAFGLVALEAMLQGTPALASDGGALPEVVGREGGWLARQGDVAAWRRALDERLARPENLRAMRESVRASASRRFSLDAMIGGLETVYSSVKAAKSGK